MTERSLVLLAGAVLLHLAAAIDRAEAAGVQAPITGAQIKARDDRVRDHRGRHDSPADSSTTESCAALDRVPEASARARSAGVRVCRGDRRQARRSHRRSTRTQRADGD